jgi:preprotein translocase subunit SecA
MIRKDQADIIYKTEEAKLRGIAWEILRLYTKQQPTLVGTRSIEMSERVSSRLTSDMLQRLIIAQRLRERVEVKKDLKGDAAKDARRIYETPLQDLDRQTVNAFLAQIDLASDVLKGDHMEWTLKQFELGEDNLHYLEDSLKSGLPHSVLNAKKHEAEAVIIAEAGRKGSITIATNMAGRGVDILLGGRVEDEIVRKARASTEVAEDGVDEYGSTYVSFRRGSKERAAPPLPLDDTERRERAEEVRALGGMFILGTERHESRRIDNQLRGRAGRQGDPGESRFYVSLEDTLWRIFNAKMLENPLLAAWPPMEEVTAKFLSRMVEKTQERIENHFFEARKHVLEYDDVLNAQREDIYAKRREILLGKDVRPELREQTQELIADMIDNAWMIEEDGKRVFDHQVLYEDLSEIFPIMDYTTVDELAQFQPGPQLTEFCQDLAMKAYDAKVEQVGEPMAYLEQHVMLRAVNDNWMNHLQTIEYIREGISLRSYGQVDPLVAYKRETFDTFQHTLKNIREQAVKMVFTAQIQVQPAQQEPEPMMMRMEDESSDPTAQIDGNLKGATATLAAPTATSQPSGVDWKRVGRNDPCPCGSGKKFKACHYAQLRQEGVI